MKNKDLFETLAWKPKSHAILAFVGAGGKTSLMYALAEQFARAGKRVIVTTTTHIFYPEGREVRLFETEPVQTITEKNWTGVLVVANRIEISRHGDTKLVGISSDDVDALAKQCDVVLVEADGARHKPIKVPAAHEPVIPSGSDVVFGVAGLDAVGQTLEEGCFRMNEAMKLLEKRAEDRITPKDVARILTSLFGTKKQVGDSVYCIVLNKADGDKELLLAEEIIREIGAFSKEKVIVTGCRNQKRHGYLYDVSPEAELVTDSSVAQSS